jgi:hypothetical protein
LEVLHRNMSELRIQLRIVSVSTLQLREGPISKALEPL